MSSEALVERMAAAASPRSGYVQLGSHDRDRNALRCAAFVREVVLSEPPSQRCLAAVIATCDRLPMLRDRALHSVRAQTRSPDHLVVVDDSGDGLRPSVRDLVCGLDLPGCRVTYVENARSPGASGSWNTGVDFLFREAGDPESIFVAILDDDDAWAPSYLEHCTTVAEDEQLDMVACGLRRIESDVGEPLVSDAPTSLCASDFLTGNPGIQGSNLFVRLSVLLAAGGFDEGLRSTTDRDLCIRIAELGTVRYGRLPGALIDHFADSNRSRLSTRGSAAKLEGLTAFWRKYVGRMTAGQQQAFLDRATALFDWRPPSDMAVALPGTDAPKKALVLGLIADNDRPGELLEVVRELAERRDDTLVGLDVVLLEQGRRSVERSAIDEAISVLRDSGAGCFRFSLERQEEDLRRRLLSHSVPAPGRPAAEVRGEMLRVYCARVAEARAGTEVWLAEGSERNGRTPRGTQAMDILHWLRAARPSTNESAALHADPAAISTLDRWIQRERVATAEQRVRRRFSLDQVRLLGCGSEAVVLTDERTVYKCIDYWKTRMPQSQLDFLRGQVGRWADAPGLYALRDVAEDGPWAVLTYDYEVSTPYQGGREVDLIRLLNGCCDVGVVCNNVHPKNLVVTQSGVKLIDYGSDIRPWSPLGFEHMARRAFLACRHAARPDLQSLMRRALSDDRLPEMVGYSDFRAKVDGASRRLWSGRTAEDAFGKAPAHPPLRLYVGVITSDPSMLKPLLDGLVSVRSSASLQGLAALVLDNDSPAKELEAVVRAARDAGLDVAVVDEAQQRLDAAAGGFGAALRDRPQGQVGIARARTMLQRYLGALLAAATGSFGWVLDDDMRVDARARAYLPWLSAFREQGTDVLIGAYEGSSPNPPLNGLRVHLVDLLHNLHWLRSLSDEMVLPDRTAENTALRARYPDYYYDLSRKHTGHLEMPHWVEPAVPGETVREAYSRLLSGAVGLLNGDPLTRPIIATPPSDPLASAKDSVNRGGSTFILTHRSLSETPNTITNIHGREARRSDMVWAIVNRHYRRLTIQAVAFPIHHVGRVNATPSLNVEKVQGEIVGSTLYAGLTEFLRTRPHHELDFSREESDEVCRLADLHLDRRWRMLEQSFHRIAGLREAIRSLARRGELRDLVGYLDEWFTPESFDRLRSGVGAHDRGEVRRFLDSLRAVADDYALATVNIDFIQAQLRAGRTAITGGRG
jgi:GT2 family glycosyltransferase